MLPKRTTCPAAARIEGACPSKSGVVCRVMQIDRMKDSGLGMDPAQLAIARRGGEGDVFLTIRSDPSTVERLCCGDSVPVADSKGHYARDSYTFCPVWQAEKQRIEQERDQLRGGGVLADFEQAEPEAVEHYDDGERSKLKTGRNDAPVGSSYDSADPWSKARSDLDILAPQEG